MFLFLVQPSFAATLNVSSSGTYTTIQSAVDAASSGDTITVSAGVYTGCVDLKGKDLSVVGAGSASSRMVVSSCTSGALIIDSGETASISGLGIDNGSGPGVVVDNAAVVDFDDVVIENSGTTASSGSLIDGGGMAILGGSSVSISESTFESNVADYGAGIYVEASALLLTDVEFSTNDATVGGGGIRGESGAEIWMEDCTFAGNGTSISYGKGGAISLYSEAELVDFGSTFSENFSATYGGAISAEVSSVLDLTDSVFSDNYVDRTFASPISGGAIFADDAAGFDVDGATFSDNVAYLYGGAIHCYGMNSGATMTVSNSLFTGNETQSKSGGAIEVSYGVDFVVSGSEFDGNTAAEGGAAISFYTLIDDQDLDVSDSFFHDNTTTSTRNAYGGAIFVYSLSANVRVTLSESLFEDNVASLSGGGFYSAGASEVSIDSSTFDGNVASNITSTSLGNYNGGGLSIFGADTVSLYALTLCNNTGDDGGAVYVEQVSDLMMYNSVLVENTTVYDGGNLYFYDVAGTVVNNDFVGGDGVVGGAMYLTAGSAVDVVNNIFAYTQAGAAVAADATSSAASSFSYNDWYSNTGGHLGGSLSFSTSSSGNTTSKPDFYAYSLDGVCSNDDLTLSSGSALIDAGDPSILDADGTDSDIGAYGGPDSPLQDSDGDGYYSSSDCDDSDSAINPGATEVCDGVDNDCDGDADGGATDASTVYRDDDGDGYGDPDTQTEQCTVESGYVTDNTDCDDSDSTSNPSGTEVCDDADNDCDGSIDEGSPSGSSTWYSDVDGDGYGSTFASTIACSAPSGYVDNTDDCDDSDTSINPDADEVCDGDDNDCDGDTDEDDAIDASTWYADLDGDGYGVSTFTTTACAQPSSYAATDDDCDDGDSAINPGADEYCDGDDNDCDGDTDEDDAIDASTWYADDDGDGHGDLYTSTTSCAAPSGYNASATDCNDGDSAINPDADEYCDSVDNDCDGDTDEDDAIDAVTWYIDSDGDGHGDASSTAVACSVPSGHAGDADDCNDGDSAISPSADEVCDSVDNDCDGDTDEDDAIDASTWYADADKDGYGDPKTTASACEVPTGHVADNTDCDDAAAGNHPDADEVCDDADNDCDGDIDEDDAVDALTWYADADKDGYGDPETTASACEAPAGYVADNTDCSDNRSAIHPDADEYCDGLDNNCDDVIDNDALDAEVWYTDADGDGYGDPEQPFLSCTPPDDGVADATDCDDEEALANPGLAEVPYDGIDNDCVDGDLRDVDGDGHDAEAAGGMDCADDDSSIFPGATDVDGDGIDANCDGSDGLSSDKDPGSSGCAVIGGAGTGAWSMLAVLAVLHRRRRQG